MRTIVLLGCLLFSRFVYCQEALQSSPSFIDWSAFIELILPADPARAELDGVYADADLIQFSSKAPGLSPVNYSLSSRLWELAKSGHWPIYEDVLLTKPIRFETAMVRYMQLDTLVEFDPESLEERLLIDAHLDVPANAPYIGVRQLLMYRDQSASFEVQTIAVGPCSAKGEVYFWLRVPDNRGPQPDLFTLDWGARYKTLDSSPGPANWEEVIGGLAPLFTQLKDRLRQDPNLSLYSPTGKLVPLSDRPCLFSCKKTELVIDPVQFSEQTVTKTVGIDQEELVDLQLVQEWHLDERNHRLYTRVTAVAPRFKDQLADNPETAQPQLLFYYRCPTLR